ncbi:unnamed protein product [Moneuplotes crassus]|uniref:Uncharacterized protein n=1 Tax=Euplotes crassus TaxID=5936 RepID=A0AAD1XG87_EUPCR|nr:unnamed protein product [Moneuplotes crassus]
MIVARQPLNYVRKEVQLLLKSRDYEDLFLLYSKMKNPTKEEFNPRLCRCDPEHRCIDCTRCKLQRILYRHHREILSAIYKYLSLLSEFCQVSRQFRDGFFFEYTFEGILLLRDCRQLMAELLYNYGVMLILLDRLTPSYSRERILVGYYRYKGQSSIGNIKEIFNSAVVQDIPLVLHFLKGIPSSISIGSALAKTLSSKKKCCYLPNAELLFFNTSQIYNFSSTRNHDFVCSFFLPKLLEDEETKMREIVDKHFYDNWVIPVYQGYLVDITQYCGQFEASRKAIKNNINEKKVTQIALYHQDKVKTLRKDLRLYLKQGKLLDEYVLDNVQPLLQCLRECNITIRWLLLHRNCRSKSLRDIILPNHETDDIIELLLATSKFEKELKDLFENLVKTKSEVWAKDKGECVFYIHEIAEYFLENRYMGKQYVDENYSNWFKQIGERIENLSYKHSTVAGRIIKSIVQALDDIEIYEPIETNIQIKHFIQETKKGLLHMVRSVNVKRSYLVNISHISDFSYAWKVIDDYMLQIQERIKEKPPTVLLIKTLFKKLASIMNLPLGRMMEANNNDIENIAMYYSSELVKYVKRVLQVIQTSIFENLEEISNLLISKIPELPVKMSKDELKNYTAFEDRYQLAKLTQKISVYTEGILCLDKALMGVIQVDPKEILVEGIRKELVNNVSRLIHPVFIFSTKDDNNELQNKLGKLTAKFKGLKKSFEYIQDFLNIPAEQIWREEVSRIFRYSLDKEEMNVITKKMELNSLDMGIPIPQYPTPENDKSPSFLGRKMNQLASILSPDKVLYLDQVSNFYSTETGRQVFGLRNSLDQILSYRIVNDVKVFIREYGRMIGGGGIKKQDSIKSGTRVENLKHTLKTFERGIPDFYTATEAQYKGYSLLMDSFKPVYSKLINIKLIKECNKDRFYFHLIFMIQSHCSKICSQGQLQLVRRIVLSHLNFVAKVETPFFYSCLSNLNTSTFYSMEVLKTRAQEIKEEIIEEMTPNTKRKRENSEEHHRDETKEPIHKVYVLTKDLDYMALNMLLMTLIASNHLQYDLNVNSLVRKNKNSNIDGPCFVMGLITIFKQFHNSYFKKYLVYMSHYIKSSIEVSKDKGSLQKQGCYPEDVTILFGILEEILRFGKYDREVIKQVMGVNFLFDNFKSIPGGSHKK